MDNATRLNVLFQEHGISLNRGALFDLSLTPKPADFDFDRVEGMLLGVAIGDALGLPTESMSPRSRREYYGEIRTYEDGGLGYPSDDTQLSFWLLEQLIKDQAFVPQHAARKFSGSGTIFGIGSTVRQFLRNLQEGLPWYRSGPHSAGNGALMRISPILVPHLQTGGTDIWVDTALATMMTHNDRSAISSCLVFVAMLWELLDMSSPPGSDWWIERYVTLARDLEGDTGYVPRCKNLSHYKGPLWRFVEEQVSHAYRSGMSTLEACNSWYSGAYLLETVPSVLFILMQHANDPEEAIIRAVNDTRDNDTVAAIVGAAVGALHGREALPQRWIENLSGRTTNRDDGQVFSLIEQARNTFWSNGTA